MLTRYVREQGWTLYSYYCDDGVSGTTFDRNGFNKLMEDAAAGKTVCTAYILNQRVISDIVILDIRLKAM